MRYNYIELGKNYWNKKFKLKVCLLLVIVALIQFKLQDLIIIQEYKSLSTLNKLKYLVKRQKNDRYWNIEIVKQQNIKQLPICVIVRDNFKQLHMSIQSQNYTNYKIVKVQQQYMLFNNLRLVITKNCGNNDIVLLLSKKLKNNAFNKINKKYQTYSIWLFYGIQRNYHIISFYASLIQKIQTNYRKGYINEEILTNENAQVLALMQLSNYHMQQQDSQQIFQQQYQHNFIKTSTIKQLQRQVLDVLPYSPMYSLSQNHNVNQKHRQRAYNKLINNDYYKKRIQVDLKQQQIIKAIEYRSILNLHINHSIIQRQRIQYDNKYKINSFQQLELCVVILSHNNIQNSRFSKVLDSIYIQQYSNYHIVFIDDFSSDKTLQASKFYSKQLSQQFYNKIRFFRNQKQKYATFNINTAAHSYCNYNDIITIVDGDDQLVGKQVFKLINAFYHNRNNWVVFSNYYSSQYTFGKSRPIIQQYFNYNKRYPFHVIGPIRTFKVSLFRKIEQKDHKDMQGNYLDTLYDDAMQYPLMEMAGIQHTQYINEICYFYNTYYEGNDDSTIKKQEHRKNILIQILQRQIYQKLDNLE